MVAILSQPQCVKPQYSAYDAPVIPESRALIQYKDVVLPV